MGTLVSIHCTHIASVIVTRLSIQAALGVLSHPQRGQAGMARGSLSFTRGSATSQRVKVPGYTAPRTPSLQPLFPLHGVFGPAHACPLRSRCPHTSPSAESIPSSFRNVPISSSAPGIPHVVVSPFVSRRSQTCSSCLAARSRNRYCSWRVSLYSRSLCVILTTLLSTATLGEPSCTLPSSRFSTRAQCALLSSSACMYTVLVIASSHDFPN